MKILFKCFVTLVLSTSILSCSSDRINEDLNTIKPLIKKFTLEKAEVSVHTNSSETIKITSGNDDYTISNKGEEFAIVKLSDDKKSLVVKGIKKGNTSVNITDNVSKTTFTINIKVLSPAVPKEFKLDRTSISVYTGTSETIKITSGNDDYTISNKGKEFATVELSADKKSLTIKGIKKGNANVDITDNVSKTAITISIKVMIPTIPHQQELPLINFQETNRNAIVEAGNESIKRYKQYLKEVNKLSELPGNNFYKQQKANWELSKSLASAYEKNFIDNSKNNKINITDLRDTHYNNIIVYGEGYTLIELLARKSEEFSKQYPNNQYIKDFINRTFDGSYSSQEGNDFITGLNRDIIQEYNKIVDLVNQLNQQ